MRHTPKTLHSVTAILAKGCQAYLLTSFVIVSLAFGGAISAGGMQAPAKAECLFVDPSRPNEPYNLIVFDLDVEKSPAVLVKADLSTKKVKLTDHFENLAQRRSNRVVSYLGSSRDRAQTLKVDITVDKPLSYDEYKRYLGSLAQIKDLTFNVSEAGYLSSLELGDQKLHGICANGYLFYYTIGHQADSR